MFALVRFIAAAALCIIVSQARAALLPPYFVSSVVALGSVQTVVEAGKLPVTRWVTEGTGFFFGYLVQPDTDPLKREYAVFLVTAGHVVKQHPQTERKTIGVRVDATEASANLKISRSRSLTGSFILTEKSISPPSPFQSMC